ncbi:MAG: 4-hydroxythreonine-4-phosphate dehydrogenase PdxA [Magnetococcales bacterium]|nr:4-hydroxythreonine-4-phosphate dehydrogenase PdxA [Magnetococcales bacterium]
MIAITMGDPAGVGPEILLKALATPLRRGGPRYLFVGDPAVLSWTAHRLGLPLTGQPVATPEEAARLPAGCAGLLATTARVPLERLQFGHPDPALGPATLESIRTAARLALEGRVSAVVTPPINKAVLQAAGCTLPGHTEILADCCGVAHPVMMLAGGGLRVVPMTIHQSLASVPPDITPDRLTRTLATVHQALRVEFGLRAPRLVVAGLNPHAGEGGAFGDEEARVIAPVVAELARRWGAESLRGPLPADTLFHAAARRTCDAVVCMYHDQALIPLKMLAFGRAVNITLGLPIVRTSVDHGTAYDIAGSNRADHRSLLAALALAERLVRNRRRAVVGFTVKVAERLSNAGRP